MSADNPALALFELAEEAVAERWRLRIVQRIANQLDRELSEGLPMRAPSSEEVALGIIKGVASELRAATDALSAAATVLKNAGKGHQASQAHQAAQRAAKAAEDLIGA